jgi:hypothetical protein
MNSSTEARPASWRRWVSTAISESAVREALASVESAADPGAVFDRVAVGTRQTHEGTGSSAGSSNRNPPGKPTATAIFNNGATGYLNAMETVAGRLVSLDGLRPGIGHAEAGDPLWCMPG